MDGAVFLIPGTVLHEPIALKANTDRPHIRLASVPIQDRVRVSIVVHALISVPRGNRRGLADQTTFSLSLSTLLITAWTSLSSHSFHRLLSGRARSIPVVHSFDFTPHSA
jgi:hypothetical protein